MHFVIFVYSGRWESNPIYLLPKQAYCRYTTARSDFIYVSRRMNFMDSMGFHDERSVHDYRAHIMKSDLHSPTKPFIYGL